ncbi:HAD family phosphatase [Streptomyces sp. ADI93-02]|uniref:HAD family hydrolase n=1 Tax=Streptomyces sp. ADI93-02 TaxID=1522757 RepID=UPI000F5513B7|nr:HAD family phosphatase [Streptomyces sp. ADI93-02]RPK32225.1 Phosphatase [Streptomyces sp. ADI93-02]
MPKTCLIVDFGGVLTTSLDEAVRGFETREGLASGTVRQHWYRDPVMTGFTDELERGRMTQSEWNNCAGHALGVRADNLLGRIFADLRVDERMLRAVARARSQGVKVGLLSNSVGMSPWNLYQGVDLQAAFDAVLLSGQSGTRKPDIAMYELITEMLGVSGEECVFVDDNAVNLPPAQAMGMTTVLHHESEQSIALLTQILGSSVDLGPRRGSSAPVARGNPGARTLPV